MVITDEIVRDRFREVARDGRISCKECMILAGELGIETDQIASTLTDMHIRIIKCQLGCFP